jgi:hypothetical protein
VGVPGFSDDLTGRDLIWRTLWAEGLATFVDARLNPKKPQADALIFPRDLDKRTEPCVPQSASELLGNLETVNKGICIKFLRCRVPIPSASDGRRALAIGNLVAKDLGRRRSQVSRT